MADSKIPFSGAAAACDAVVDLLDAGASAGILQIWEGVAGTTPPTNADDAISDDDTNYKLLAELTLSDPAFGAATDINPGARATANAITDDTSANKTGTAEFYRAVDSNGVVRTQGDVTATGGGGNLELDSINITAGQTVSVTSFTVTMPES